MLENLLPEEEEVENDRDVILPTNSENTTDETIEERLRSKENKIHQGNQKWTVKHSGAHDEEREPG